MLCKHLPDSVVGLRQVDRQLWDTVSLCMTSVANKEWGDLTADYWGSSHLFWRQNDLSQSMRCTFQSLLPVSASKLQFDTESLISHAPDAMLAAQHLKA